MSADVTTAIFSKPVLSGRSRPVAVRRPDPPTPMARFSSGDRVGSFQILNLVEQGGTAEVYRASHPTLGEVALKISSNGYEHMLRDEALALRRLADSKNTSRILSYGLEEGWHCMAMEYISGQTVKALLNAGPIDLPKTLDIITQVCYGLNNFHQQRLAHLDVKPGNILIGKDGQATLIDAGNVRPFSFASTEEIRVTLTYASPEQLRGKAVDNRSDIFNLGLTMFAMLTGHHAFAGEESEVATQLFCSEVPMLPDTFHPQIRAIVGRMTAHDPAHRYQDVMEIVRDIRLFTENQ